VPRAQPSTRAAIAARPNLGLGPVPAQPVAGPRSLCIQNTGKGDEHDEQWPSCRWWNFGAAIDRLGKDSTIRELYQGWLSFICGLYELERRAEKQEAPAAKAGVLRRAGPLYMRRQQALAYLKAIESKMRNGEVLPKGTDKKITKALRVLTDPRWLSPAIEHEVARLQLSRGRPWNERRLALRDDYLEMSKRERCKNNALRNTIRRLQACWPRRLSRKQLMTILKTAGIKHPRSPSKFYQLMQKTRGRARTAASPHTRTHSPAETAREQRLSKVDF
jgi:hypothetical protein